MTDYTELVDALRYCVRGVCKNCSYFDKCKENGTAMDQLHNDAAAAIEALQAEVDKREGLINKALDDNADLEAEVEALQAEVERLKEANEELREKQTYIDHYGDTWMTSANDVPTAAYKHGYADGRDEAEAQLPKRGEFEKSLHEMFDSIWDCDINHPIFQDTVGELMEAVLQAYDTVNRAKMEVQDGK